MHVVSVVSTKGGVGKTTVAANLGGLLADAGLRVLLLDLDSQPTLSTYYAMHHAAPAGVYELLALNLTDPAQVLSNTAITGLDLILSNDDQGRLGTLLLHAPDGRLRLRNLLDTFRPSYELLLIDTQGARSVVLEMALLCSDLAISPITPDMLAAREFYRGTQQLLKDLEPLAALGVYTPPLNIVINKLDATNDASLIYQSLTETLADHPQINLLQTTLPAAVSFRRAATEGIPAHRLEYRQPLNRRSPSAFNVIKALAVELFPEWKAQFELLSEQTLNNRRKADQEVAS